MNGFVCIKSLVTRDLPGYLGERQEFVSGKDRVSRDHAVVKSFPDHFAPDDSTTASRALAEVRNRRRSAPPSESIDGLRRRRPELKREGAPPKTAKRSSQLPSRRATRGDDIYDLSTVRFSAADPGPAVRELRDRAMRAIERARFPHGRANPEAIQDHLADLVEASEDDQSTFCRRLLITGSPRHRELFAKAVRGMRLADDERRALSLDGPHGGFAVPFNLDPTIIPTSSGVENPLREISRTETTLTDKWQGVSSDGITAGYRPEETEAADNAPGLAQPEVDTASADAFIPFAFGLGQDQAGLEPQIASLLQRSKDELEATKFLSGDGEDEPLGLLAGATEVEETAAKEAFAKGDLTALEGALPAGFLSRAKWLGSRPIFQEVREFDTEGGAPIWSKLPGERPEINELPAYELSTMDSTLDGENKILVLGDFDQFLIVDRIGMAIKVIEQVFGANGRPVGESGLFALWRNGSTVLSKSAFRVLEVKAT